MGVIIKCTLLVGLAKVKAQTLKSVAYGRTVKTYSGTFISRIRSEAVFGLAHIGS